MARIPVDEAQGGQHGGRAEQHEDERIGDLVEHEPPDRHPGPSRKGIRAGFGQALPGVFGGQPLGATVEPGRDLVEGPGMDRLPAGAGVGGALGISSIQLRPPDRA